VADFLAAAGFDVTPVFISVDPARDTPSALAEYTDNFGPTLLGLTGSAAQVKSAANAFKVYFQIPENTTGDYSVDHTTLTYLVLPGVGFVDFYARDTSAQSVAIHAGCILLSS
jgi:protein SCO1